MTSTGEKDLPVLDLSDVKLAGQFVGGQLLHHREAHLPDLGHHLNVEFVAGGQLLFDARSF